MAEPQQQQQQQQQQPKYILRHAFNSPWTTVVQAFWLKYPHPSLPHVKYALVLDRFINPQGQLVTKRIMCVQQKVPWALQSFTGGLDNFYAIEETVVDAKARTLQLTSTNLSFNRVMEAVTLATYSDDKMEEDKTIFTTQATVTVKKFPRLIATKIETSSAASAMKNAKAGLSTMELLCATRHF